MVTLLKNFVICEWIFFFLAVITYTIVLWLIKGATKEKLLKILLFGGKQDLTLAGLREKFIKASNTVQIMRTNIIVSSIIVVISLLLIGYLVKTGKFGIPLAADLFFISVWAIMPIPLIIVLLEYFVKRILSRIDDLSD